MIYPLRAGLFDIDQHTTMHLPIWADGPTEWPWKNLVVHDTQREKRDTTTQFLLTEKENPYSFLEDDREGKPI